jgi:hypothetical protein
MDQVGSLLKKYTGGGAAAAAAPAPDVHAHFDQVAQAAPSSAIAEGLAAAFRSDQTPAFGQMVSTLFTNSNGDQKAGMLNHLMSSISPSMLAEILPMAGGLAGKTGAQITPEQAQQISPQAVQQLAAHAEKNDPSIVGSLSSFYAQHSALVKTRWIRADGRAGENRAAPKPAPLIRIQACA